MGEEKDKKIDQLSLKELRKFAEILKIRDHDRFNRTTLLARIDKFTDKEIRSGLRKYWLSKHLNHIYGIAGIIGLIITVVTIFYSNSTKELDDFFDEEVNWDIDYHSMETSEFINFFKDKELTFLNQLNDTVFFFREEYEFKILVVNSIESPCKAPLETLSIVNQKLSPYLSIEPYVIFLDSIGNSSRLREFCNTNNLDITALHGTSDMLGQIARFSRFNHSRHPTRNYEYHLTGKIDTTTKSKKKTNPKSYVEHQLDYRIFHNVPNGKVFWIPYEKDFNSKKLINVLLYIHEKYGRTQHASIWPLGQSQDIPFEKLGNEIDELEAQRVFDLECDYPELQ